MTRAILIAAALLCSTLVSAAISLESAVSRSGTVLFMRHALAPGFGDPEHFQVDRCETQRILNETGRQQARVLGEQMRSAGLHTAVVYSSQWCRCLETAELLGLGPVIKEPGLNSFFQGHTPRDQALQALKQRLETLPLDQPPVVMVTHQVTISAVTGLFTQSGGLVSYDLRTGRAEAVAQDAR
ncbi:MAG: histidine phosphatase family protein [Gammaproteobacteria bacterium]|nr:histidine phosphatase family protein [Gammaproteobacteria bacterium]